MDTSFKFSADNIGFELEGTEAFVRSALEAYLPYVRAAVGSPGGTSGAGSPPAAAEEEKEKSGLARWYGRVVPKGESPTMQDHILIFAYYLNREEKQFIFVPDDMKLSFKEIGHDVPKSLLQILGSLKRDRGLLYSGDKRGEYSITPDGLRHVESVLGLETVPPASPAQAAPAPAIDHTEEAGPPKEEQAGGAAAALFRHIDHTGAGKDSD